MKEMKNPYNYNLNTFKTLAVNEEGVIIGGTPYNSELEIGEELTFSDGDTMKVLDIKKVFIVNYIRQ